MPAFSKDRLVFAKKKKKVKYHFYHLSPPYDKFPRTLLDCYALNIYPTLSQTSNVVNQIAISPEHNVIYTVGKAKAYSHAPD